MIYLIGGASRSGKTMLALRMLGQLSIPYFSTDFLMMGLSGAKLGAISTDDDDLKVSKLLQPILTRMIGSIRFGGRPYVLEGVHLGPSHIRKMIDEAPNQIAGCVLGYPNLSVEEKLRAVLDHPAKANDWLINKKSEYQRKFLGRQIKITEKQHKEAQEFNIQFFDTGLDYDKKLAVAFQYLTDR